MTSPPAWSIGTSKRANALKINGVPGPGSYSSGLKNGQSSPGWKLGTASRSTDKRNEVPGPGTYSSSGKIYLFGVKTAQPMRSDTPGPGTYNGTGAKGFEQTAPSFSFRAKSNGPEDKTKVPGPGTYNPSSRLKSQTSPSYKIGTSQRESIGRSGAVPGPGTYATRPDSGFGRDAGPKYVFGKAGRDSVQGNSLANPGPGTYNQKGAFDTSSGKGTTLLPRRPESGLSAMGRVPGPGAYNLSTTLKGAPAYGMGSASRDSVGAGGRSGVPGPGNYEPRLVRSNQNIKIGTSSRSGLVNSSNTPGPGTYTASSKVGEGPKYIMNPRREERNAKFVPGPGAYNPSAEYTKDRNPSVKMGSSSRDGFNDGRPNPGPGQYDVRGKLGGPKWGFGSEMRGKDGKAGPPGPGSYNLPPKIADVPSYVFAGKSNLKIRL